jgi:hypothetical protein
MSIVTESGVLVPDMTNFTFQFPCGQPGVPQTDFCFGITGSFLQEYVTVINNIINNIIVLMIV